jgi:hypothetical protein
MRKLANLFAKTKKARESDRVQLIVLALCGPMNGMIRDIQVIGSIKLTNDLSIPRLAKLHQLPKIHPLQIMDQLLQLQLRQLTKAESINVFHVKHRRHTLRTIKKMMIDQVVIEVEVKMVPKTILKPEVLAFFLIEIGGTIISKLPQEVSVVNLEMRSITFSFIGSALWLLDLGRITLEWNKLTLCEMLDALRRGARTHVRSNGAAFYIQGFFSEIHSRYVANARNKLPRHCTN